MRATRGACLLLLVLASCGGGDRAAPTDSTTPVTAPTTSTTVPFTVAPTNEPTTAPTSTVVTDDRFDPPCVERSSTPPQIPEDDPALDALAPFGAEPVVQLELPRAVAASGTGEARGGAQRIPGGMLVSIRPYDGGGERPYSQLVAIDADGAIRWQRCLDPAPAVVMAGGGDAGQVFVGWIDYGAAGVEHADFQLWSLADGSLVQTWQEALAANGISGAAAGYQNIIWTDRDTLFVVGPNDRRAATASDGLLVLDVGTMDMRVVPYPPGQIGLPLVEVQFRVTADGRLLHVDPIGSPALGRVFAVESAASPGGWSTDAADLDDAVGERAGFEYSTDLQALVAVDAQGTVQWRRDDLLAIRAEGFSVAVDGEVVLAAACSDVPQGDEWCPGPVLVGVDLATGRTRWQRDGRWNVSVLGDGRAMISPPYPEVTDGTLPPEPPWLMVDLTTGEQVGASTWTEPWRFGIGCCDAPEGASIDGGVVFTFDDETVEMWYPQAASTPLRRVTLDLPAG